MNDEIEDPRAPGWRFRVTNFSPAGYQVDGLH